MSNELPDNGPLPAAWMDRIFSKLSLRFGRDFLGRWEGQDLTLVKADWAEHLAGLQARPKAIKYALENIGGKPPTVDDFKALCNRAPEYGVPKLDAPKADQKVVERASAMAKDALKPSADHLETLRELANSDARDGTFKGRKVTMAQRQTYRQALGLDRK